MERLTRRLPDGSYDAGERETGELVSELGKYEDFCESLLAERELVRLNLEELSAAGKTRTATYTTLMGSRYMLDDMLKRLSEPQAEAAARLANMKRLIGRDPDDDGIHNVEECIKSPAEFRLLQRKVLKSISGGGVYAAAAGNTS